MCILKPRDHIDAWKKIDAPDYVLHWINNGIVIPFSSSESVSFELYNRSFSRKESSFLRQEISRLIDADCIEQCVVKPTCVNPIHCVPKKEQQTSTHHRFAETYFILYCAKI